MTTENESELFFNQLEDEQKSREVHERSEKIKQQFLEKTHRKAIDQICGAVCMGLVQKPLDIESEMSWDNYRRTVRSIFEPIETYYKSGEVSLRIMIIKSVYKNNPTVITYSNGQGEQTITLAEPQINITLEMDQGLIPDFTHLTKEEIGWMEFPFTGDDLNRYISRERELGNNDLNIPVEPLLLFRNLWEANSQIDLKKSQSENS